MASQRISRLNNASLIGFSNSNNNNNNNNNVHNNKIKLLILGAANVGKTAFVVRLITKRFIGEYDQNKETLYTHRLQPLRERDDVTLLEILDSANNADDTQLEANIRWADGLILIYSVSDRKSFEYVERLLGLVLRLRANSSSSLTSSSPPGSSSDRRRRNDQLHDAAAPSSGLPAIAIAANKIDCPADARRVTVEEGLRLVEAVSDGRMPLGSIVIREISVAESPVGVASLVEDIVRQMHLVRHQPHQLLFQQQIKGSSRSSTPGTLSSPSSSSSSPAAGQHSSSPPTGSPSADRMSSTLTNVRRVLRDKIYNRSRSDTVMTVGGGGAGGGTGGGSGGLLFSK